MQEKKSKSPDLLQKQVDDFNAKYKVGDPVSIYPSFEDTQTVTVHVKHKATVLSGHSAVGWFEELKCCYNLDLVQY